jgi:hypothetical protein
MKSIRAIIGELDVCSRDADFKAIQDVLGKDAKNISVSFQSDGKAKKKSGSQLIFREAERLYPIYTELKGQEFNCLRGFYLNCSTGAAKRGSEQ